ncbi:MAG: MaoC family dehydratase [Hyphomicrobiaceae bacterium]
MQDDAAAAGSRLYWEDLEVGRVEHFGHYEVTKEEIIEFASTYDPQAMHLDEEAAKHTVAGGLCASGFHTCAMLMRMLCDGYLNASSSLGATGIEEVRWMKPVRPGTVLSVRYTCTEKRASASRPGIGIAKALIEVLDDKGEVVMSWRPVQIFGRRTVEGEAVSAS